MSRPSRRSVVPAVECLEPRAMLTGSEALSADPVRHIQFAGRSWTVKESDQPVGPGPNYFSAGEQSVWVDDAGALHLRLRNEGGVWKCAELYSDWIAAYGTYRFYIDGRPDLLDRNVTGACFLYATDEKEIDIEFARWSQEDPGFNAQYVVQPWYHPGNMHRFSMSLTGTYTTHSFTWQPGAVSFRSWHDHSVEPITPDHLIQEWTYSGPDVPAEQDNLRVHLNLWLYQGAAPSDGQEAELVIKAVDLPAAPTPPPAPQPSAWVVIGDRRGAAARTLAYTDADGSKVKITMTGGLARAGLAGGVRIAPAKSGTIDVGRAVDIVSIALSRTDGASALVFSVSGGADNLTDVGTITGRTLIGKISAGSVLLTGGGLRLTGAGAVGSLNLRGLRNGAGVLAAGPVPGGMTFHIRSIASGSVVDVRRGPVSRAVFSGPMRGVFAAGVSAGADAQFFTDDDVVTYRVRVDSLSLARGSAGSLSAGAPRGLLLGPRVGSIDTGTPVRPNTGACVDGAGFEARVLPGPAASIAIVLSRDDEVYGRVGDVAPEYYKVLLYAYTNAWYIQPWLGSELSIDDDLRWSAEDVKPGTLYAWLVRLDVKGPDVMWSPLVVDGVRVVAATAKTR